MASRAGRPARARPHRRCVGCGRIAPKNELLRIALRRERAGGALAVPDPGSRMPGRGAYLCTGPERGAPAPSCLQRALQRDGISRTLRCKATMTLVESVGR